MKKLVAILKCSCGAQAKDTSKERGRFLRRHARHMGKELKVSLIEVEFLRDVAS